MQYIQYKIIYCECCNNVVIIHCYTLDVTEAQLVLSGVFIMKTAKIAVPRLTTRGWLQKRANVH